MFLVILLFIGIAYYIIFHYIPMYGIVLAFKDYRFRLGILKSPWIGLENFYTMFRGVDFPKVFRNTLIISFYKLITGFPAPIILALLLNEVRNKKYKKTIQTISYLPHFLSWIILAGVFIQLLSPSQGPVNYILKLLGFEPIYFLGDPKWFRFTLVATSVWKGIGWGSIIYLASISSINPELYEAAYIDGANDIRILFTIILPVSTPIIATVALWSAVGHWNAWFDALIYITKEELIVLQVVLRKMIVEGSMQYMETTGSGQVSELGFQPTPEIIKSAAIIVSSIPIIMVYPFVQKYFIQGIMIGSLKG